MIELLFEYLSLWCIWPYVPTISCTSFRVALNSIVAWISRSSCSKHSWYLKFNSMLWKSNPQPLCSWTNTLSFSQINQKIGLCCDYLHPQWISICVLIMSHTCFKLICSLNFPEYQGNSFLNTWLLSGCNAIWTEKHLVLKWKLNSLARRVKWLGCVVKNYLYGEFDYMFLSCHVSEWIYTL